MKKHPRLLEAIEKARQAAICNRGMYPFVPTSNVFKQDGSPLEEHKVEKTEEEQPV